MTIGDERSTIAQARNEIPSTEADNDTKPDDKQMATVAKDESTAVASTAIEGGREVMSEISEQASVVADNAKDQLGTLVSQAKDELKAQGEARGQQIVTGMQAFSDQLSALVHGRPHEAGNVGTVVRDAQQRVQTYVGSLQERGPRALVDDVSAFARRRPATFLLAASITGFAIGRLVRSGAVTTSGADSRVGTTSPRSPRTMATVPRDVASDRGPAALNTGLESGSSLSSAGGSAMSTW